jgi:hypothetical protein
MIWSKLGHTFQMKIKNLEKTGGVYVGELAKDIYCQFLYAEDFMLDIGN